MKRRLLVMVLAVSLTVVAVGLFYGQLRTYRNAIDRMESQYTVVPVAINDVEAYEIVRSEDVRLGKVSRGLAKEGDILSNSQVVGKMAVTKISRGDPILRFKLAIDTTKMGMAFSLSNGRVAMAIPIDEVSGVAGNVRVGDRVDLVHVEELGEGNGIARVLLSGIKVLAVGTEGTRDANADAQSVRKDAALSRTFVLEITPKDESLLAWAQTRGEIRLALKPVGSQEQTGLNAYMGPGDCQAGSLQPPSANLPEPQGQGRSVRGRPVQAKKPADSPGVSIQVIAPGKTTIVTVPAR